MFDMDMLEKKNVVVNIVREEVSFNEHPVSIEN